MDACPAGSPCGSTSHRARAGPVPVRVYLPPEPVRSVLLWAHGGGFTGGNLDIRESAMVCAELADRAQCAAVAVNYRLAVGGVRYPAPLDDVHAAWRWVLEQWRDLPAIIGGASAGAALAMATAGRDRDAGAPSAGAMLLAYPLVHADPPPAAGYWADAIRELPAPARLPADYIAGIVRDYVGEGSDVPAEAFPGASRMEGLPATAIVIPEYDGLRSAAHLLEGQLRAAGVPVRSVGRPGGPARTPEPGAQPDVRGGIVELHGRDGACGVRRPWCAKTWWAALNGPPTTFFRATALQRPRPRSMCCPTDP